MPRRAMVLLRSGRRINLLDPLVTDWGDGDLAIGLARTYRWEDTRPGIYRYRWRHSLTVLALRQAMDAQPLANAEALRELPDDGEEGFLSWDPISPLKPYLGPQSPSLVSALNEAIWRRYRLQAWTPKACAAHKHADRLATASEAFHAVGWSLLEI